VLSTTVTTTNVESTGVVPTQNVTPPSVVTPKEKTVKKSEIIIRGDVVMVITEILHQCTNEIMETTKALGETCLSKNVVLALSEKENYKFYRDFISDVNMVE
jgi:hypothetical protein